MTPPGPPQSPPGYYPQPGWGAPPPKQGSGLKWLLVTVAILLVVAITVGITLFFTRESGGGTTATQSPDGSGIASANDTGPVSIITVEPTCDSWRPIQNALAASQSDAWGNRDPSMPSSQWTSDLRAQYEAAGAGMRSTADQAVRLAEQTPHRAMRELYEQFIAYGRAYANSLTNYTPSDDALAHANVGFSQAISAICDAIQYGNLLTRASGVPEAEAPTHVAAVGDPADPSRFTSSSSPACVEWIQKDASFIAGLKDWSDLNPDIPASQWSPEYRSTQENAAQLIENHANDIERIGRSSENAVLEDIATLAALYMRAYVQATPTYTASDNYLGTPGLRVNNAVKYACQAADG